jgi:bacteriorhodopsin
MKSPAASIYATVSVNSNFALVFFMCFGLSVSYVLKINNVKGIVFSRLPASKKVRFPKLIVIQFANDSISNILSCKICHFMEGNLCINHRAHPVFPLTLI